MLAAALVLVAFDFQNVLAWWRGRTVDVGWELTWDFTIIVPLFGRPHYFKHRRELWRYRENTLLAIEVGNPLMAEFADQIESLGWRVSRIRVANPNPALLIREALAEVRTTYAFRLDGDTLVRRGLPQAVKSIARSGADLCSFKVHALEPKSVAARLQALEYRIAMLTRHFRPWLTSGACFIGKTEALRRIYDVHSCWSPGEDIETGRVAHALKLKIRHVDMPVYTEVPDTFLALFRQRRLWWAGTFRHWFVNGDRNIVQLPVLTSYYVLAIWTSVYYRWWELIEWGSLVRALPLILAVYVLVTAVSNLQVLSPWMLVLPIYALVQSLVLPTIGACYYVVLACRRRSLGRYRFGYRRGPGQAARPSRTRSATASISIPEPVTSPSSSSAVGF
jgi:hypothetical protein